MLSQVGKGTRAKAYGSTDWTEVLLLCGLVAGPLFMFVVVIQASTRAGFDLGRHPVSLLSLGVLGGVQIANFIASGLLCVAFAVGIRRALHAGRGGTLGPLLVGAYGVGLVIAGLFSPDPAYGFPPGTPEGVPSVMSWHSMLHGVGFTLAFISLSVACFVFARNEVALGSWKSGAYSTATAVTAITLSMWPSLEGASVRYFVAAVIVWTWVSVQSVRLMTQVRGAKA